MCYHFDFVRAMWVLRELLTVPLQGGKQLERNIRPVVSDGPLDATIRNHAFGIHDTPHPVEWAIAGLPRLTNF